MTDHVTQAAELVERLRSTWPKSPDFGPITTAQRDTIHEAADLIERLSAELAARSGGWVVGNADGTRWRAWEHGSPVWVSDQSLAVRYSRRSDAESAHEEDEDAWKIVMFTPPAISSMEAPSHG